MVGREGAGDIIQAAGVQGWLFHYPLATARLCELGTKGLPFWYDPLKLIAQILEVVRADN